ncbi:Phosphatidate cytidylyltransferase [bacterium HR40]|nr:Phosphatidate cytidylyltransferase [bacterium HR40]
MAPRQDSVVPDSLPTRAATAAVLVVVVLAVLVAGGLVWTAFLVLVAALAAHELGRLVERRRSQQQRFALAVGLVAVGTVIATAAGGPAAALLLFALLLPVVCGLYALAGGNGLPLGAGALYLSLPLAALTWLRLDAPRGLLFTLWLLCVVGATDTAAYFAGRAIGGPRLAPVLSPGKTWAGLFGGMLAAAMVGGLFVLFLPGHGGAAALFSGVLAMLLAVVAQCGDLAESWIKRRSGYKDSGRILPGHGGVLDRIDGLLFAAPLYAAIVAILTGGVFA